jgi:hypothetical protein
MIIFFSSFLMSKAENPAPVAGGGVLDATGPKNVAADFVFPQSFMK